MQPLSESEQREAIALIGNMPFDTDVIVSIRRLLRNKAMEKRVWKQRFQDLFMATSDPAALDDTQPYRPLEHDGD